MNKESKTETIINNYYTVHVHIKHCILAVHVFRSQNPQS